MMSKIWEVARHEFLTNVKRPSFIIATIAIPVLGAIGILVAGLFGGQVGTYLEEAFTGAGSTIAYVDQSGLFSPMLPEYEGRFVAYENEESARAAMLSDQIPSYLLVPADYLETGTVYGYSKSSSFLSSATTTAEENIQSFFIDHVLAGKVETQVRARAADPVNLTPVALDEQGKPTTSGAMAFVSTFLVPYLFALLLLITIFTSSGFLLQGVGEEKENRVIEILLSSVTTTQLLAGKILGLGALGITQVLVWIGAGAALASGAVALFSMVGLLTISVSTVVLGLLYFVLGFLLFATMMASAGALGSTAREGQQISGIFSFVAAVPFMFSNFILMQPNSVLAKGLSYFPLTGSITMMMRLPLTSIPAWEIAVTLVLQVLGILVVLWAGGKLFRFGLLMYGKRPSVAEMWQALRQT
jgi:ABC-2 type transport system permease protein